MRKLLRSMLKHKVGSNKIASARCKIMLKKLIQHLKIARENKLAQKSVLESEKEKKELLANLYASSINHTMTSNLKKNF